MAQTKPLKYPAITCASVCSLNIILDVPSSPATSISILSPVKGYMGNILSNMTYAPVMTPIAAVWMHIFHFMFIIALTDRVTRNAMSSPCMYDGMASLRISRNPKK